MKEKKEKRGYDRNKLSDTQRNEYKSGIITDPDGSWTGTPENIHEVPVQDVDDL